jgi:hypothetical protein
MDGSVCVFGLRGSCHLVHHIDRWKIDGWMNECQIPLLSRVGEQSLVACVSLLSHGVKSLDDFLGLKDYDEGVDRRISGLLDRNVLASVPSPWRTY